MGIEWDDRSPIYAEIDTEDFSLRLIWDEHWKLRRVNKLADIELASKMMPEAKAEAEALLRQWWRELGVALGEISSEPMVVKAEDPNSTLVRTCSDGDAAAFCCDDPRCQL